MLLYIREVVSVDFFAGVKNVFRVKYIFGFLK